MDKLIHEQARLRIMAYLFRKRDASFVELRDAALLTDGNFAAHAKKLEDASYVSSRRVLDEAKFVQRYQITKAGHEAFLRYLDELELLLQK